MSIEEIVAQPASRMVVRWPGAELEDFVAAVEGAGLHGVNYAIGYSAWLDVMPPGVSKASGLEALRVRLGVPEGRTAAFGDGLNDLEMLAWATYAVAMGDARRRGAGRGRRGDPHRPRGRRRRRARPLVRRLSEGGDLPR